MGSRPEFKRKSLGDVSDAFLFAVSLTTQLLPANCVDIDLVSREATFDSHR